MIDFEDYQITFKDNEMAIEYIYKAIKKVKSNLYYFDIIADEVSDDELYDLIYDYQDRIGEIFGYILRSQAVDFGLSDFVNDILNGFFTYRSVEEDVEKEIELIFSTIEEIQREEEEEEEDVDE